MESMVLSRGRRESGFAVALVVLGLLALMCTSCIGAPRTVDELGSMEQLRFEKWRDRIASNAKAMATDAVAAGRQTPVSLGKLSDGMRALAGKPFEHISVSELVGDGYGAVATVIANEVQAYIDETLGDSAAAVRVSDLLIVVAHAIDDGATAGAAKAGSGARPAKALKCEDVEFELAVAWAWRA